VSKVFTPRLVENMRERIQKLTDELLDKVQNQGAMDDLIHDFALPLPLPATIIAEILGVPVKDRHKFHRWSKALIAAGASTWGLIKAVPNAWNLMRYLRKIIKLRRAHAQDDLISSLARAEEQGDTFE
jgi:cytochrome P450